MFSKMYVMYRIYDFPKMDKFIEPPGYIELNSHELSQLDPKLYWNGKKLGEFYTSDFSKVKLFILKFRAAQTVDKTIGNILNE